MRDTVFIFDFDGTIADTLQYVLEISNRLADEFGYKTIHESEVEGLKGKRAKDVLRHVGIPHVKIPAILKRARSEFRYGIEALEPIAGLREVLHKLRAQNLRMGILSSNSVKNIEAFLGYHELEVFDFVHSSSRLWGKNVALKKMMSEKQLDADKMLYIGDEVRDIVAAQKAGIRSAAVTWGYNTRDVLSVDEPDYLLSHPDELLSLPLA